MGASFRCWDGATACSTPVFGGASWDARSADAHGQQCHGVVKLPAGAALSEAAAAVPGLRLAWQLLREPLAAQAFENLEKALVVDALRMEVAAASLPDQVRAPRVARCGGDAAGGAISRPGMEFLNQCLATRSQSGRPSASAASSARRRSCSGRSMVALPIGSIPLTPPPPPPSAPPAPAAPRAPAARGPWLRASRARCAACRCPPA